VVQNIFRLTLVANMILVAEAGFVIPLKWHLFRFSNFVWRSTPLLGQDLLIVTLRH